ncbi:hypothetical protein AaE_000368 [Aphanomyces astaci]|uniref:TAFII55 protein conserved region domain-containing protein n=1 Tax=Aphanomyces astaci TaxID=112090 RepID=A0A6A5B1L3_APHAT|nr:hypothetical protein AaE_000368 [Aphanomyces astaci]
MMEQYLLRVPKRVGEELRKKMAEKEVRGVDVVAGGTSASHMQSPCILFPRLNVVCVVADNRNFKFRIDDTELPATLCQLPCIVETHKTYDEKLFYKSGDIGQILLVHDTPEEQMLYETVTELPGGITPPTTNIVKRKYAKTRKSPIFPKADVARVEDTLVKIIAGGIIEDVQEELVDFYDWMVDDEHPNGIVVHDEMDFIQRHPEDDDDDAADGTSLQSNPEYLTLLNTRAQQTKKVSDLRKDISKMAANITSMANPVMKQRLLAQKESLERELADVQAAFEATADDIRCMESGN